MPPARASLAVVRPRPGRVEVPDAAPPGRGLSPWMREASRALAETLFWTEAGPPPAERLSWLVDDLDDYLARAGTRARSTYLLCLVAVAILAPMLVRRLPPLQRLDAPSRMAALERAERGVLGLAVFAAKAILCILYYEDTEVAQTVGFDGTCLREPAATERGAEEART